ncbi:TPA: hypothetical protein L6J86_003697, partial [Escherichia coli]|nr:hypothetical protein [Escherichia coli]
MSASPVVKTGEEAKYHLIQKNISKVGLRELGTSGEKIPLLSTANTWSARQTFNGGITGALTGNADTAT